MTAVHWCSSVSHISCCLAPTSCCVSSVRPLLAPSQCSHLAPLNLTLDRSVCLSHCTLLAHVCTVCGAGSVSVRPSIRLSVSLSHLVAARHCSGFAAVGLTGRRYQLIATATRCHSMAAMRHAAAECGQCHVVSWRRKLNGDLLSLTGVVKLSFYKYCSCHN